uniref:Uncharacterized protein n=1 Tax=Meloidogyne enterolobii TaxID=390850 RepID=A0A6V7VDH8_MELEN|nr:unnamed protein product [Meloidogyne enterolobii]
MRHWRLFIYFIILNIYFICVENTTKVKSSKESKNWFNWLGFKNKSKNEELTKEKIPLLPNPKNQNTEENINEAFTTLLSLCSQLKTKSKKQKFSKKELNFLKI